MKKILFIDDHPQIQELMSRRLRGLYDVTVRSHAANIVSDFERLDKPVVVLDVWMPKMDGFTAATLLKVKHPDARIIFLSSDESPDLIAKAYALGGCAYVVKSRAAAELVPAIEARPNPL